MAKYTLASAKKRTKFVSRKTQVNKKINYGGKWNLQPYSKALFEYYRTNVTPPGKTRPNYSLKMAEFKKIYDTANKNSSKLSYLKYKREENAKVVLGKFVKRSKDKLMSLKADRDAAAFIRKEKSDRMINYRRMRTKYGTTVQKVAAKKIQKFYRGRVCK